MESLNLDIRREGGGHSIVKMVKKKKRYDAYGAVKEVSFVRFVVKKWILPIGIKKW